MRTGLDANTGKSSVLIISFESFDVEARLLIRARQKYAFLFFSFAEFESPVVPFPVLRKTFSC